MNRDEIKSKFLETAKAHGEAVANVDHHRANRLHRTLTELYKEAKRNQWLSVFLECINDSNESISVWAATYSLLYDQTKAENKLIELSNSSSVVALSAETTLQMWKKGMLNLL